MLHQRLLLPTLAVALLGSCGTSDPAPRELPGLVRLWEVPTSERVPAPDPVPAPRTVHREDFSTGSKGWFRVVNPEAPLTDDPGAFRSGVAEGALELAGTRGGMYRIVPVEPGAFYEFTGRVRTEGLEPETGSLFHGATFFLGELPAAGTPEEVFGAGAEGVIRKFHNLQAATGTTDWTERSLTLCTGPETRALLVTCVLGLSEEVRAGSVHFDDLELVKMERRTFLEQLAREAARERLPLPQAGWRGERLVRESFGAETRPSLVALPGEALAFQLYVPRGAPRLTAGLGAWTAAQGYGFEEPPTFVVRVNGRERLRRTWTPAGRPVDARWDEVELDLGDHAGENTRIELAVEGAPGVFGSALVEDTERGRGGPNLILVSIDTLRADHVGAYGAEGDNTPHLDALAASGTLVRDVTSQAPYTLPSQVSMFSGQIPSTHGVIGPGRAISPVRTPMLAEILARAGYVTRAFTAGGFVNAIFGFDRGFDGYSNVDPLRHPASKHATAMIERQPDRFSRRMFEENGVGRLKDWLGEHRDQRFFLFLHTYTVHDFDPAPGYLDESERIDPMPYMHHEYVQAHGITDEVRDDIEAFYDAALRYVDEELGKLLAHLETLGLADDTIIAVTSDHGKELGERGLVIHGTTLYEELTRIPMILRVPGRAPEVLERPAMLIDLSPTLLSALGLGIDPRMQGLDLLGEGLPADRVVWSEVDQLARKFAVRDADGLKVIHGPPDADLPFPNDRTWELYSLGEDPGESTDLAGRRVQDRERLARILERLRRDFIERGQGLGAAASGTMDAETLSMLQQLGYL